MRRVIPTIVVIFLLVLGCSTEEIISDRGTIRYIDLEGGFYGIIADNGERYDPLNLPEEFKQDSLRVKFTAVEAKEQASFHMWGTIVEITRIEKVKE
ncbi:MAG: hypothetical protein MAGBODY4_01311 [Candidatus Marinimicrobia bacterium]|nr:hypothetical protein [Candidatus Neomarinimicrobiota bacterium]